MKDLTETINEGYSPFKALLFYKSKKEDYYVESYDMGLDGRAINAHPLNLSECQKLANGLDNSDSVKQSYLQGKGIFPENLLYLNSDKSGFALWHSPAKKVNLFFKADLGIADGMGEIPPMLWLASRDTLQVWALKSNDRPTNQTVLYHAPFFNVYDSGAVCMGNVKKHIPNGCSLTEFISLWEKFFFNSTFSHTLMNGAVKGDTIISIWKKQMAQGTPYPLDTLIKSKKTLNHLLR